MFSKLTVLFTQADFDRRLWFVWLLDSTFFGAHSDHCYAVIDDFGNLRRIDK